MKPGDRVLTPLGQGVIVYQRMAPPDYSRPAVFSVRLNGKAADAMVYPGIVVPYIGTIFPVDQVIEEP